MAGLCAGLGRWQWAVGSEEIYHLVVAGLCAGLGRGNSRRALSRASQSLPANYLEALAFGGEREPIIQSH